MNFKKFSDLFIFMYDCFAYMYVYMSCQIRVADPLELDLWMAVSHYVGAKNKTRIIYKHKCS